MLMSSFGGLALSLTALAATPPPSAETPPDSDAPVVEPPEPPAMPDIRGSWRMDLSLTTQAKLPVLGETTIQTASIYLVRVEGTPDKPLQIQRVCSITPNASRSIATTTIPPGFIGAVPEKRYILEMAPVSGGWRVRGDMQTLAVGFDPETQKTGVPQKAGSEGILDFEGDGNPGATVHIQAPLFGQVEVYMVQRARTVVEGVWDGRDEVKGRAIVKEFAQRTVGASNRLFIANPELRAVPETSIFRMKRVPAGSTCADLVAGLAAPPPAG